MILNFILEDTDILKFNVKRQDGTIVEINVYTSEYGDSLEISSNTEAHEIDSSTLQLSWPDL